MPSDMCLCSTPERTTCRPSGSACDVFDGYGSRFYARGVFLAYARGRHTTGCARCAVEADQGDDAEHPMHLATREFYGDKLEESSAH